MTRTAHSKGHRLRILATVLVVGITACGGGSADAPTATSGPTTSEVADTTSSGSSSTSPITATPPPGARSTTSAIVVTPSQTGEAAHRDGVIPEVAALPMNIRVAVVDEIVADEGVWAITTLSAEADGLADGCRLGPQEGKYPTDFICTFEYGELLLLDHDRSTILRAYPLPGIPAEHIAITDDAVYCGRHGALPMPDSMICRVDRTTFDATVKVYQPGLDSLIVQPCFFPPATWSVVEEPLEMLELEATSDGVFARTSTGTWTSIDPDTLLVGHRELGAAEVSS